MIQIDIKHVWKLVLGAGILAFLVYHFWYLPAATVRHYNEKVTCAIFDNQPQAQKFFESDKERYASLDGNHDGKACQALPKN